jgi:threonine synthase
MKYISTRGESKPLSFSEAVAEGLASDGGLYVPEKFPQIDDKLDAWQKLSYSELCFEFMKLFATDIPEADLKKIVDASYSTFDDSAVAPLKKLDNNLFILELFHGPTLAFKDFALQFLGNLYEYLLAKSGKVINVLGATSGDTGSAAINGLLGKKGVKIFILYPNGRVSPLQERQMACTEADNVYPIAIDGTFDDAQAIVK